MAKKAKRTAIKADNNYVERHEHRLCATPGCRNVVAVWAKLTYCSLCRRSR